ncbi:MAG TPA: hypothetical protein PK794_07405 [Armatimonadota bacterium]|nr:hypothetical protein [Armatimonadota bacterium]
MKRFVFSALALCLLAWATRAQETTARPAASLLPDISIIGNVVGTLTDAEHADIDDHLQLKEVEVVFGAGVYPGIRGDVVIALHDPDFSAEVEEGYVTIEQLSPGVPVGGRLGILRIPFGKVNPVHPHQLPYADTPAAIENLVGDEFIGNGFEAVGLIPLPGKLFLQAQVGRWNARAHHHHDDEDWQGSDATGWWLPEDDDHHAHRLDFTGTFTVGRLWSGIALRNGSELELGISRAIGGNVHYDPAIDPATNTQRQDADGNLLFERHAPDLRLQGYDVTWRHWLPEGRRILLQGEYITNTVVGKSKRSSDGYYLLGAYRPSPFYEFGMRYDWSQAAWPARSNHPTAETAITAFATRQLNETTYARLQLKHGKDLDGKDYNEATLQVVFGFGPHAHVLQ